ncbi:MAG: hypothetical protein HP496_18080 [Nitrospira sp.]|nr:hypothetical protein [Nitrospira sp.]
MILRGVVGDLVKATTLTVGANLEQLDASQTGNTMLNLRGNALNNTLIGNDADNLLAGLAGNDTLNGGAGNDILDGGLGQDTVNGGAGDDRITMLLTTGNVDTIDAGDGIDTLVLKGVVPGNNHVVVDLSSSIHQVVSIGGIPEGLTQRNFENIDSSGFADALDTVWITGSDGDNVIIGSKSCDIIDGGAGNDTIIGGLCADNLQGGPGDDLFLVGSTSEFYYFGDTDIIDGGAGTDTLRYTGTTAATLTGGGANIERIEVANSAGDFSGTAAININATNVGNGLTIVGNNGVNILTGTSQADTLIGHAGNDMLRGGLGSDTYQINRGDGQDKIADIDGTPGNSDQLLYGATINPLDLVLSRQANDLRIALHGTTDSVTIQNWYASPTTAQVETIQAGNSQQLLNTQVDQLIQAMATFTTQTGLSWDAAAGGAGDPAQQAQFQGILAANWQP